MAKRFETSKGDLAQKMVDALKEGSERGGDKRVEKSATLIVVSTRKVETEIKIDKHKKPVEELIRKLKSQ